MGGDLLVAQIGEVAQFDDLAARPAQLIQGLTDQRAVFGLDHGQVRARGVAGRINGQAGLGILGVQGKRDLPAAALGRAQALAVVVGLVGGDAKEPGLELAVALEGAQTFDDGQKGFLADFLHIFAVEIRRELEDETPRRRVVQIKKLVPSLRLAATATGQQLGFRTHFSVNLVQETALGQSLLNHGRHDGNAAADA